MATKKTNVIFRLLIVCKYSYPAPTAKLCSSMYYSSYSGGSKTGTIKVSGGTMSKVTTLTRKLISFSERLALSSKSISNKGMCTKSYRPFMSPQSYCKDPDSIQLATAPKVIVGVAAFLKLSIALSAIIFSAEILR